MTGLPHKKSIFTHFLQNSKLAHDHSLLNWFVESVMCNRTIEGLWILAFEIERHVKILQTLVRLVEFFYHDHHWADASQSTDPF